MHSSCCVPCFPSVLRKTNSKQKILTKRSKCYNDYEKIYLNIQVQLMWLPLYSRKGIVAIQYVSRLYKCTSSYGKENYVFPVPYAYLPQFDFSYSNRKLEHFFLISQGPFVRWLHTFLMSDPIPLSSVFKHWLLSQHIFFFI